MKKGKWFTFTAIIIFFGLLFAACDNGTDLDTTQGADSNTTQGTAPQTEIWSEIKNVAFVFHIRPRSGFPPAFSLVKRLYCLHIKPGSLVYEIYC